MKNIAKSLAIIAGVAAIVTVGTIAFFSDKETSVGNTFTAGTIDISVAGQNPWNKAYPMELDKPCETNYINFTIENVGENPANVWKRINNVTTNDGNISFCGASSEPEYVEGGGTFDASGACTGTYTEQNNLAAYMIYDMYICHGAVGSANCPVVGDPAATSAPDLSGSTGWEVIISEDNQIRIDNVNGIWIKLDDALAEGGKLAVSQSYHLMAWDDAGVETITNWAQGDKMTFDIELEARQLTAPAPESEGSGLLVLNQKDPTTWEPIASGANGTLTYKTASDNFEYDFSASGLENSTGYSLIYYADPWPGDHPGALIGSETTDSNGGLIMSGTPDLAMDLPGFADANYPAGAKIQLVLTADYDGTKMTAWNPSEYLFEMNLIQYDDTNI